MKSEIVVVTFHNVKATIMKCEICHPGSNWISCHIEGLFIIPLVKTEYVCLANPFLAGTCDLKT